MKNSILRYTILLKPVHILSVTFSLIIGLTSFGQNIAENTDSTLLNKNKLQKTNDYYTFSVNDFYVDTFIRKRIDTTLTTFLNYDNNLSAFYNNLGNIGTAQQSLIVKNIERFGLNYQIDNLSEYRFNTNNVKFYNVSQPFASAFYVNGAQREEQIDVTIAQNIRNNSGVNFRYRKISSEGFYSNQQSAINNVNFNHYFQSKNHRYQLLFCGIYNDTYNEENGGIANDSIFTQNEQKISRKGIETRFENATNRSRNQEYFIKQHINFGDKKIYYYQNNKDSTIQDSVVKQLIIPQFTIEHTLSFQHQEFTFEDNDIDSNNYNIPELFNGSSIFDKTLLNLLDNQIAIITKPFLKREHTLLSTIAIKAGIGFQYGNYTQTSFNNLVTDEYHNNSYLKTQIYNNELSKFIFSVEGNLIFSGYNAGDYTVKTKTSFPVTKKTRLNIRSSINAQKTGVIYNTFNNVAYNWKNDFRKTQYFNTNISLKNDSNFFQLGISFEHIINYVYFTKNSLPKQHLSPLIIARPYIEKLFNVRQFHLKVAGGYQFINPEGVINLPTFYSYNSIYYENTLFQNEMLIRIGTDLFYTSRYAADNYNPITRQFYIQSEKNAGNYLWLEPFIMSNVDRFYFFVKMSNINEGLVNNNYLARGNYPMQDRALKFSIKWDFIN